MNTEEKIKKILASGTIEEINRDDIIPEPLADGGYYMVYFPTSLYHEALVDILQFDANNLRIWYDRHLEGGKAWEDYMLDKLSEFDCIGAVIYLDRTAMQSPFFAKFCQAINKYHKSYCTINYERDDNGNTLSGEKMISCGFVQTEKGEEALYKKLFSNEITFISGAATIQEKMRGIQSIKRPDVFEYEIIGGKAVVAAVRDVFADTLKVPEFVDIDDTRYSVTAIAGFAFANCRYLKEVIIPEGVQEVGGYTCLDEESVPAGHTFLNCRSLRKIVFPESVKIAHQELFNDCVNLRSVSMTGVCKMSPEVFGYDCPEKIQKVLFSEDILYACGRVYTPDYKEISAPEEAEFYGATKLMPEDGNVELPEGADASVFAFDNEEMKSIVFPESYEYDYNNINTNYPDDIAELIFNECAMLERIDLSKTTLPKTLVLFINRCPSLNELILPNDITGIDLSEISGCDSLKSLTIPGSVESIYCDPMNILTQTYDMVQKRKDKKHKEEFEKILMEEGDCEMQDIFGGEEVPRCIERLVLCSDQALKNKRIKRRSFFGPSMPGRELRKRVVKRSKYITELTRRSDGEDAAKKVSIAMAIFRIIPTIFKVPAKIVDRINGKARVNAKNIAKLMPDLRELYVAGKGMKIRKFKSVPSDKEGFAKYVRKGS